MSTKFFHCVIQQTSLEPVNWREHWLHERLW